MVVVLLISIVIAGPPLIYVAAMSGVRKPFLPVDIVIRSPLDNDLAKFGEWLD